MYMVLMGRYPSHHLRPLLTLADALSDVSCLRTGDLWICKILSISDHAINISNIRFREQSACENS